MAKKFVQTDGKYVDNGLNTIVEEGTYFNDAAIIPLVQYQVYGLDNVWFWDNEGQNYAYDGKASEISIQVFDGSKKTYKVVGNLGWAAVTGTATGGTKVDDFETIPEGAKVGDLFYTETNVPATYEYKKGVEISGDEPTYELADSSAEEFAAANPENQVLIAMNEAYPVASAETVGKFYKKTLSDATTTTEYKTITASLESSEATTGGTELPEWPESAPIGSKTGDLFYVLVPNYDPAEATASKPYEFNKYGNLNRGVGIHVTLTPNSDLAAIYRGAIITINGKEYDLNHTEFDLTMDKDYRISIHWLWGQAVETFRITYNR